MEKGHHIYIASFGLMPPPPSCVFAKILLILHAPHTPPPPPPGVFVGRVKYLSNINPVAVRELRPVFVQYLCKYSPPAASALAQRRVYKQSTQTQWGDKGQLGSYKSI